MKEDTKNNKIVSLDELASKVETFKNNKQVVIQSHGVFDLIHPGIIQHLESAKNQGNVLIVTIIKDKDVKKGPNRPIFPEKLRAENIAALTIVDFVCVVDDEKPFDSVNQINPDFLARGQAYKEQDRHLYKEIYEEQQELFFGKTNILETPGISFDESEIKKNFTENYPDDTKIFLESFSKKYNFKKIADSLNKLKDMNVLVIGDGIIDEYHYCEPLGKSGKTNLIVFKYQAHETFVGGAIAIANHVAGICNKVELVTLLGKKNPKDDLIKENIKPNIIGTFFYRDDGPTIVKKRYLHQYLNQKVFEVNFINDQPINNSFEKEIISSLSSIVPKYDLVLVSDFGHGFITPNIFAAIKKHSKFLSVNTQTNGANSGYNLITKYNGADFVCLDEGEVRLAAQEKYQNIETVAKNIRENLNINNFIVTLGKKGSLGVTHKNTVNHTPIFSTRVLDTIGAGDAYFSYTAPCTSSGLPLDLVSFIGNAAGAIAVQIMGNKRAVEKYEVLELISELIH
tara:strand:+ start:155 stop:1690 length:1536 start_codon:yes stop_codon:yes gene_type:complete